MMDLLLIYIFSIDETWLILFIAITAILGSVFAFLSRGK